MSKKVFARSRAAGSTPKRSALKPIPKRTRRKFLSALGVQGFDSLEHVILASLVTEDPLLLIGKCGTGKTYLLNSISEALDLEHRHYNASLISFDDLVGFPYPDDDKTEVRFLETPATVWGAESVLIDEISRCKPEHQNRLFSLVHERRIQGISLPKLRYRWAAMNPCGPDQDAAVDYAGSEPLDQALADRFSLIVEVGDWGGLTKEERERVADPAGEGAISDDGGRLAGKIEAYRAAFLEAQEDCPQIVVMYACAVTTALNEADIRVSPRRARLLARSLLASIIIGGRPMETRFRDILHWSLPDRAWGASPKMQIVNAAHKAAWSLATKEAGKRWLHEFHFEPDLSHKVALLLSHCPTEAAATTAVTQLLRREPLERAAVFAFALYPAALAGRTLIGAEGIADLGKLAVPIMAVDKKVTWQERTTENNPHHPELARFQQLLSELDGGRQERAKQLFYWCVANDVRPADPEGLESQLHGCVRVLSQAWAR